MTSFTGFEIVFESLPVDALVRVGVALRLLVGVEEHAQLSRTHVERAQRRDAQRAETAHKLRTAYDARVERIHVLEELLDAQSVGEHMLAYARQQLVQAEQRLGGGLSATCSVLLLVAAVQILYVARHIV